MKKHLPILLLLQCAFLITFAQEFPNPSNPPRLVNDFGYFFSPAEVAALETKLVAYDDSTSNEIAIVTMETIGDYEASDYANRLFEKWKIGKSEKDNGILILLSKEKHDIWIEVGYGLEGKIPDMLAKRIIDEVMKPNFKVGNFYHGMDEAINSVQQAAIGEYKGEGRKNKNKKAGPGLIIALIVLVVIFIINRMKGGSSTYSSHGPRGGGLFFPGSFGGFGGGGGGGGFGGGGFGGFGGGGSGGGGAGGNW